MDKIRTVVRVVQVGWCINAERKDKKVLCGANQDGCVEEREENGWEFINAEIQIGVETGVSVACEMSF